MTFNWDKFYDVGVCLKRISEREEYQRSAVGRYYYAAFGLVRKYYEEKYLRIVPSYDAHSFLINELEKSSGDEKILGKKLRKIRRFRNYADYDNIFHFKNVGVSEEIYHEIKELLKNLK